MAIQSKEYDENGKRVVPIASEKLIKWLTKRRATLQKEHDTATDLDVKKVKGARLKQISDVLEYIDKH